MYVSNINLCAYAGQRKLWLLSFRNSLSCFSKQDFLCTSLAKLTIRIEQGIYLSLPAQYLDYNHSLL